ncbi:MAG: hypothetical protein ASUL_08479 [Candidatus Aramenus sulfurataquae]|uniref:Uncharacterized protein n=1 Tax=Candidatus Aramenus sulfurataquae TaxID=1326980 RepID=W7KHB5_9CREN|nr:MAG: hypothetical protein ASUL_08479 [Candidatus Aramenus sulfurataquae]
MRKNLVIIGIILIIAGIVVFFLASTGIISSTVSNEVVLQEGRSYNISVTSPSVLVYKDNYSIYLNVTGYGVSLSPIGTSNGAVEYQLLITSSPHVVEIVNNYSQPVQVIYVIAPFSSASVYAAAIIIAVILFIAGLAIAIYGAVKK